MMDVVKRIFYKEILLKNIVWLILLDLLIFKIRVNNLWVMKKDRNLITKFNKKIF